MFFLQLRLTILQRDQILFLELLKSLFRVCLELFLVGDQFCYFYILISKLRFQLGNPILIPCWYSCCTTHVHLFHLSPELRVFDF